MAGRQCCHSPLREFSLTGREGIGVSLRGEGMGAASSQWQILITMRSHPGGRC